MCPSRFLVVNGLFTFIIVLFNFKLISVWSWLAVAEYAIVFNVGAFIVINLYIYSLFGALYLLGVILYMLSRVLCRCNSYRYGEDCLMLCLSTVGLAVLVYL